MRGFLSTFLTILLVLSAWNGALWLILGGLVSPLVPGLSMGMYRSGDSILYINPGTNFWGIPFRVGALPEVTVVTLRRGESGPATAR